jgi:hypothetical protein
MFIPDPTKATKKERGKFFVLPFLYPHHEIVNFIFEQVKIFFFVKSLSIVVLFT